MTKKINLIILTKLGVLSFIGMGFLVGSTSFAGWSDRSNYDWEIMEHWDEDLEMYADRRDISNNHDDCKEANRSGSWYRKSGSFFETLAACTYEGVVQRVEYWSPMEIWGTYWDERPCLRGPRCDVNVYTTKAAIEEYFATVDRPEEEWFVMQWMRWTEEEIEKARNHSFNTPFVYLENAPTGNISIDISSEEDKYTAQDPEFNKENWWEVRSEEGDLYVDGEEVDELYYELAFKGVQLTRNWKNFDSKEGLLEYKQESDFFEKLWLTEEEKNNSIEAIKPKLPEAENYYLTILEEKAIEDIVNYDFSEEPEELIRRYYAVYPTENKVRTTWDLQFPDEKNVEEDEFIVKDYGEVVVKEDMLPLWK